MVDITKNKIEGKGEEKGNPDVQNSSSGNASKGLVNEELESKKGYKKIQTGPSTHSTLSGSTTSTETK